MLEALLFLHRTVAFGDMGVAVIELTLLVRLLLLPLTVLSERSAARRERLAAEVDELQERYRADPVQAKEEIRALLRVRKVHPWAKALTLALQLGVMLSLYRVFAGGFGPGVEATFLGFDLREPSLPWALAVGIALYVEISYGTRKGDGAQGAAYRFAFPLFSAVVLSWLPMVKALFVLTSMAFSVLVSTLRRTLWPTASTN